MKRTKYSYLRMLCTGLALSSLISCSKDNSSAPATQTLAELINQDTSLTVFKAVLEKTNLKTFATGPGPFTLFAPSNTAYKQVGVNSVADVQLVDPSTLVIQTTLLIAPGVRTSDVLVGDNLTITTQLGSTIFAQAFNNEIYFNGRKAAKKDLMATNGAMHILNDYLSPTLGTTTVTLAQYPTIFKLWAQAVTRSGLGTTSGVNRNTTTLFAPTNTAMIAAGLDSLSITKATVASLATLVKYNLLGVVSFKYALKNTTYKTDQGSTFSLNLNSATPTITGNKGTAGIVDFDIPTSNGVIHTINSVLRP